MNTTRRGFLGVLFGSLAFFSFATIFKPFKWLINLFGPKDFTVYCHAQLGNDSNDGLTTLTPVKTIKEMCSRVPKKVRNCSFLLQGDFEEGQFSFNHLTSVQCKGTLYIDGGPWEGPIPSKEELMAAAMEEPIGDAWKGFARFTGKKS